MAFASLKNTIYSWFTKEPLGIEHGGTGSNSVDVVSKIEELESALDSVSQETDAISQGVDSLSKTPPISYHESNFPLNKPDSMAWGRIINLAKDSDGDRYYLAVDNNSKLYVGVAVNGTTTVTWVTK